jgi:hypothetical protein
MIKKILLLASLALGLAAIISADVPPPPCDPYCGSKPPTLVR